MANHAQTADDARPGMPASAHERPGQGAAAGHPLVVLANDPAMLLVLKESVGQRVRIWRADDELHAAELVVAGSSGILFIDIAITREQTEALVERLHTQLPDLPIIVTGRRDDEASLGGQISSGAIFRFLHKPVSPERVRNFVEAAIRRRAGQPGTTEPSQPEPRRERPPRVPLDPAALGKIFKGVAVLAALGLTGALVAALLSARPWERVTTSIATIEPPPAAVSSAQAPRRDDAVQRLLGLAGAALQEGRLIEPAGESAIEFYRAVLAVEPDNREAREGLAATANGLIAAARQALDAGDLPQAASALDAARGAEPAHPQLQDLSNELAAARERATRTQVTARVAELEAARDAATAARVAELVALAEQRLQQNRLVNGADSALAYITEARQANPNDAAVQRSSATLAARLLANARQAQVRGDFAAAGRWTEQAAALGGDPATIASLRAAQPPDSRPDSGEDRARLLALANQRIAQGQLLDPPADSASHYLDLLRAVDAEYDGLSATQSLFAARVLDAGKTHVGEGRYAAAERAFAAAATAGASPAAVGEARAELAARQARAQAQQEVLPESALTKIAHTPAKYPARAVQRNIEGWVDVEFTVARDGSTRDARIVRAEPSGIFDESVLDAVAQWRYSPRIVAGEPIDQRLAVRLRFALSE